MLASRGIETDEGFLNKEKEGKILSHCGLDPQSQSCDDYAIPDPHFVPVRDDVGTFPRPLRESGFAYGRSKASPDSEKFEPMARKCKRRNISSVEQIQDREEFVNERSEFTNSGEGLNKLDSFAPYSANCVNNSLKPNMSTCVASHNDVTSLPSYLPTLLSSKRVAFTLAEVLITLGIIGVVAAITIPPLIKNYKKHEIEVRFKQNYNLLSNAIQMAQAEYGDPINWEGLEVSTTRPSSLVPFDNYIARYLKIIKKGKFTLSELGYKTPIYSQDGKTIWLQLSHSSTRYVLNNGSIVVAFQPGSVKDSDGNNVYYKFLYYVDLNGAKGPNTIGKDIFGYDWHLYAGSTLGTGRGRWAITFSTNKLTFLGNYDHQTLINYCKDISKNGLACGALIQENGWRIPSDYPLKF